MKSKLVPLFPLKLVAFPGEQLNLHVFEPRYKQLVRDCICGDQEFGVCVFTDKLQEHGTMVKLLEIYKEYEDGRMDIKTIGTSVFRLKTFENPLADKMYAGGEVELLGVDGSISGVYFEEFLLYLKEFLRLIGLGQNSGLDGVNSFTYAHQLGLKLEEEYELLKLPKEMDRIRFLTQHLKRILPVMRDLEKAKERIKMNGHFKSLDPLDF